MNKLAIILALVLAGCNSQPTPQAEAPAKEVTLEEKLQETGRDDWVVDGAKLFTSSETRNLRKKLSDFQKTNQTKPQIVVLTVNDLGGQNIEEFTNAYFKKVKIGDSKHNNGILVVIAKNDRKLRIEIGYGLEGKIPDMAANTIIRERMVPNLQKGSEKWYVAVNAGVDELIHLSKKD